MRLRAAIAVSIPLLVGQVLTAETARAEMRSVTAIRHWSLGEVTRVAIEVNGDFQFRSDRLHNPERLYFDILNARPSFDSRRQFSEPVSDRLLQRVRVAETVPGITRVVLDLAGQWRRRPRSC